MSRSKKLKLFANAILMDVMDSNSTIEIFKHGYGLIRDNNDKITLCTMLQGTEMARVKRGQRVRENWRDKYNDKDFYFHFHMKKRTFFHLLKEFETSESLNDDIFYENESLTLERCLFVTLWYLAKGVSCTDVSEQFDMAMELVSQIIDTFVKLFVSMQYKYIIWPNQYESQQISKEFQRKCRHPDILGVIGSTHINIKPPVENEVIYRNKNLEYSVILQVVCNSKMEIINMYAGFPGSVSNSVVLKHSLLHRDIQETGPNSYFYEKYHLVGDDSYPLRSWLMVPYKSVLSYRHFKYNRTLKDALTTVEYAFTMLKERWKVLKLVNVNDFDKITDLIEACCMLHNFCLRNDDKFDKNVYFEDIQVDLEYVPNSAKGEKKRDAYLAKNFR